MRLDKKKIFITGATSEVGRAIAQRVYELGGSLFLTDQDEPSLKQLSSAIGTECYYKKLDLSLGVNLEFDVKEINKVFGDFHGFVYAEGEGCIRPLSLTKPENMLNMMNANCFSFVELIRWFNKIKGIETGGSIIAISSVSSIKGLKSKLAYASSKAALDASVRCLAAELGGKGIRVNSILKGALTTDRDIDYVKSMDQLNENETSKKQFLGDINPSEIANMVCFLLSDAVKTLTGTSIILDGGYTL